MPCTLNKATWEKLIDEDIDWLDKQPDTLECKHIRQILEWTKKHKPDKEAERIAGLEAENKRFKELMKGATLDYGYANGWGKDPLLIKECKAKNHKRNDRSLGHFDNIVWCETCGYQYKYDSS